MDHKEVLELLPAYADQELGVADMIAVERHLGSCAECQREYAEQDEISRRVRDQVSPIKAPAHLLGRIQSALPRENAPAFTKAWRFNFNWLNLGSALAAVLAVAWSIGMLLGQPSADDRVAEEVVASHVRSLQVDHLADVASTDQHTVKPWFNGKLNFSPTVADFVQQGFPLVGGRLDYFDGRPVAALIYRHNLHPINLYTWPSNKPDSAPQAREQSGYHLLHWYARGMEYWAISDVASVDLERFGALHRAEASVK